MGFWPTLATLMGKGVLIRSSSLSVAYSKYDGLCNGYMEGLEEDIELECFSGRKAYGGRHCRRQEGRGTHIRELSLYL